MAKENKGDKILDALQELLETRDMEHISVSEIAKTAGIGKGSIYYYFPSKEAVLEALIERNYEKPIETAKKLADETTLSPFMRMAMIFQACRSSSSEFLNHRTDTASANILEQSMLHQKYLNHLITELKPVLTAIIQQGIDIGEIHFEHPEALAEIVLIILAVKLDNTLLPSSPEEIQKTIAGLVALLEKGTENPAGSLDFLMTAQII